MAAYSIGLTGGIGSGKSAVADALEARGAAIIDTDVIAHRLTAAGGAALGAIAGAFGTEYITKSGAMDRARVRALVFSDETARKKLQTLLHPMISAQAEADAARAHAAPYLVFVVPLLVESRTWLNRVDRVLVVDCSSATQVERVNRRSGLNEAEVRAIMQRQTDRPSRLRAADDVIFNEGSLADLLDRVGRLHQLYCRQAAAPSL